MEGLFDRDVRELLSLAVILAVALAQGQDADKIGRMSAFFEVLGDILALFALQPGLFRALSEGAEEQTDAT